MNKYPLRDKSPEELWQSYGRWVQKIACRVASLFTSSTVKAEDLWGVGCEQLQASAGYWSPDGGASFLHFTYKPIRNKMLRVVWKEFGDFRPRPATWKPGLKLWQSSSCQELEEINNRHKDQATTGGSLGKLARQLDQYEREQARGSTPLYYLPVDELVDTQQKMKRVQQILQRDLQSSDPHLRRRANRFWKVQVLGISLPEVAQQEKVSKQAIYNAVVHFRKHLIEELAFQKEF